MQAVQDYASLKAQLEEKVANLKRERDAVLREVESLSQEVTVKELEWQARSLEGELDGPKGETGVLEQKLASLDASPPPRQRSPVRQVGREPQGER